MHIIRLTKSNYTKEIRNFIDALRNGKTVSSLEGFTFPQKKNTTKEIQHKGKVYIKTVYN